MIQSFAPRSGTPGTTVTVTGSGFGTDPQAAQLVVGGSVGTIATISDTQITFAVTTATKSGTISVEVDGTRVVTLLPFLNLRTVSGTLHVSPGMSTAGYRVGRGLSAMPVNASGGFTVDVPRDAPQLITAWREEEDPLFMAVVWPDTTGVTVNARSTAIGLAFSSPLLSLYNGPFTEDIRQRLELLVETAEVAATITATSATGVSYLDDARFRAAYEALLVEAAQPTGSGPLAHPEFNPPPAPGVRAFAIKRTEFTPQRLKPTMRTLPGVPKSWAIEMEAEEEYPNLLHEGLVFLRVAPSSFPSGISEIERMDSQSAVTLMGTTSGTARGFVSAGLRSEALDLANQFGKITEKILDAARGSKHMLSNAGFLVPKDEAAIYEVRAYSGNLAYGTSLILSSTQDQTVTLANLDRESEWLGALATNVVIAAVDLASLLLGEVEAFQESDICGIIISVKSEVYKAVAAHVGARGDIDAATLWDIVKSTAIGIAKSIGPSLVEPTFDELFTTKFFKTIGKALKVILDATGKASTILQIAERSGNLILPTHFAVERTMIVVGDPFAPSIDWFFPLGGRAGTTINLYGRGLPSATTDLRVAICTFAATGSPPTITASLNCAIVSGDSQGLTVRLPNVADITSTFGPGNHEFHFAIENVAANSRQTTRDNRAPNDRFSYLGPPTIVAVQPGTVAPGEPFTIEATGLTGKKDANVTANIQGNILWSSGRTGNKLTFVAPGFVTPGATSVTLELRDPSTTQVRHTSAPFPISLVDPWAGSVGSNAGGLDIIISKWDMSNAADGYISIYEAFALAGGTLGRGLEQHPTPEDTERREVDWVSGEGGGGANVRDSIRVNNGLPFATPLVLTRPLPKLGNGDHVQFGGIIDGSSLPEGTVALDLVGLEGVEFQGAEFRNFSGPGIRLGAGSIYNYVLSAAIAGCADHGIVVEDGARGNTFWSVTVEDVGGDGILITGANTSGNMFASASAPPIFGGEIQATRIRRAGGVGVRINGGASDNIVDTYEVRDCISHGIEITGEGTVRNAIGWVAGMQNIRFVAGNGGDGVRIGDGASGTLTWYLVAGGNAGHGYHVFGPGTQDVNLRGPWTGLDVATDPEKLRARRNAGYSIVLRDVQRCIIGAPDESVLGDDACIGGSDLGGILLDNADDCELRGLPIGEFNNLFGEIDGDFWLPVGAGHAVHLTNGSSGNLLGAAITVDALFIRGAPTGSGIWFDGEGTDNNLLFGSTLGSLSAAPGVNPTQELMYGISITDGASGNIIGAPGVQRFLGGGAFFKPYNSFHYASAAAVRIENVAADLDAGGEPLNPNQIVANTFGVTGFGAPSLQPYVGVLLKGATRGQIIGGRNQGAGNQMSRVGWAGIHLDNVTADNYDQRNRIGGNWISSAIAPADQTNENPLVGPVRSHAMVISGGTNQVVGESWDANNQFFGGQVGIFINGGTGHRISSARVDNHPIAGIVVLNTSDVGIGGHEPDQRLQLTRNGAGAGTHASAILIAGGSHNFVSGCWIGEEGTGDPFWANPGDGIRVVDSHHNILGGAHPGQKNFIVRCGRDGVHLRGPLTHSNTIGNNTIGLTVRGSIAANSGAGIHLTAGASNNRIGGPQLQTLALNPILVPSPNIITASGSDGVLIDATGAPAVGNSILGNSIYNNTGLGINLVGDGNHAQPPPQDIVFDALKVAGSVVLAATPAGSRVEMFTDNDLAQPEGEVALNPYAIVQADGTWSLLRPFIPVANTFTFTVTNVNTGDTSEFTTGADIDVRDALTFRVDQTAGAAPAGDVWPGGAAVPVLGVTVASDNVDVVINQLDLELGGTADLPSLRFAVYHDTNRNGQVGPGDRLLCPETEATSTDLSLPLDDASLLPDEAQRWLVVARATSAAPTNRTLNLRIAAGADVLTRMVLPIGAPITPLGTFPLLSEAFTIGSGSTPGLLITAHPTMISVTAGGELVLSVTANGANLTYQWLRNGLPIPGATNASYTVPNAQTFHEGMYSVIVSNSQGSQLSGAVAANVIPAAASSARLLNLSTRGFAGTGANQLFPGFVISGTGTKRLLIRAVGPTLGNLVPSLTTLPDPRMELKRFNFTTLQYEDLQNNDDWGTNSNAADITTTAAQVFAFPFTDTKDAAVLVELPAGQYAVVGGDKNGASAIGIVELYDADTSPTTTLINISNRGFCGVGDNVMIPGFVVSHEGPKTFLVRVVGPTLAAYGVPDTMADPKLEIFPSGSNTPVLSNDNWGDNPGAGNTMAVASQVFAFPLASGSADAAFVVTLPPGGYTVVGSSATPGATGVVLVEVYVVP